jgi:hypothetical protein
MIKNDRPTNRVFQMLLGGDVLQNAMPIDEEYQFQICIYHI